MSKVISDDLSLDEMLKISEKVSFRFLNEVTPAIRNLPIAASNGSDGIINLVANFAGMELYLSKYESIELGKRKKYKVTDYKLIAIDSASKLVLGYYNANDDHNALAKNKNSEEEKVGYAMLSSFFKRGFIQAKDAPSQKDTHNRDYKATVLKKVREELGKI